MSSVSRYKNGVNPASVRTRCSGDVKLTPKRRTIYSKNDSVNIDYRVLPQQQIYVC